MNLLIVEVDDEAAGRLDRTLTSHGYGTVRVTSGMAALDHVPEVSLVLLDLALPDLAGHEVCRRIRESSSVPIIALSEPVDELDRVMALHMGADDFVLKPFGRHELVARIQAVLRRCEMRCCTRCPAGADGRPMQMAGEPDREPSPEGVAEPLRVGRLRLDSRARRVFVGEREVRITRKEFDLLAMLMEAPGAVMERGKIMSRVWDENWFGSTRTLDVHVGSLRSKLGSPDWIQTVRGVGYRLCVPESEAV